MRHLCLSCLLLAGACLLLACGSRARGVATIPSEPVPVAPAGDTPHEPAPADARWHAELLAVAAEFRQHYTKLSDDPNWAPTMCRAPLPTAAFKSRATTSKAHGRKLYFLWVKDSDAYQWAIGEATTAVDLQLTLPTQPVGQALVKEAYHPANADGKSRALGEPSALFVMLKLDPATEGTDAGWIYGTLTPDGRQITSAGLIESCMDCHGEAGQERLFGPPTSDLQIPRTPPRED
ncbi:MAG: hypothetical protein H6839_16630 [Planctomycetes bacterium]|nr:hypothetical protein [Planctomycetota bacterium]